MGQKIQVNPQGATGKVAPNEVYEKLAEKLLQAYFDFGKEELEGKGYIIDLGKLEYAILQSTEYMLNRLRSSEFTIIKKGGDDGEKQN